MEKKEINSLGYITKDERVGSVENYNFSNLVLEGKNPFPGFYEHENTPGSQRKRIFMYMVLNPASTPTIDTIFRASRRLEERLGEPINTRPAELYIYNSMHRAIRIITSSYEYVEKLIEGYKKEGLDFIKNRYIEDYNSSIKLITFFELEEIKQGVFIDKNSTHKAYLSIPSFDNNKVFAKINTVVKNTLKTSTFDAALSSIYQADGLSDFVRIYTEKCTPERLAEIRTKYIEEIQRNRF